MMFIFNLVSLRKFEEALICCGHGLCIEAGNTQLLSLRGKCEEELLKIKNQLKILNDRSQAAEKNWIAAWSIMLGSKDRSNTNLCDKSIPPIAAGYASASQQPAQLREVLPHFLSNEATGECNVGWPVVLLYPQYSQIDVIEGVSADDMLAIHLAEMFPELADLYTQNDSMAVSWDRDREYQVSQLAVYAPLEAAPRIDTLDEWLDSCREQSALRGELGVERSEVALKAVRKRSDAHELRLSQSKTKKPLVDMIKCSSSSSSALSLNNFSSELERVGYLDVHLGCSFRNVLACPGHVVAGGLLTLLVFVRGNSAHTKFLDDIASNGHGVWSLNP